MSIRALIFAIFLWPVTFACKPESVSVFQSSSRNVSEVQLRAEYESKLNSDWALDPRNEGTPLFLSAEQRAEILISTVRKLTSGGGFTASDPTYRQLLDLANSTVTTTVASHHSLRSQAPTEFELLSKLAAINRGTKTKSGSIDPLRISVLIQISEVLQDPEVCLELHDTFLRQSDKRRAFAALEHAILIEMRRSTDKHLKLFRQILERDKATHAFHDEQEAYIQSLLDRFTGSLE